MAEIQFGEFVDEVPAQRRGSKWDSVVEKLRANPGKFLPVENVSPTQQSYLKKTYGLDAQTRGSHKVEVTKKDGTKGLSEKATLFISYPAARDENGNITGPDDAQAKANIKAANTPDPKRSRKGNGNGQAPASTPQAQKSGAKVAAK